MPLSIEDQLEIQRLISRYNFAIDAGKGDDFAACFVPDGVFRVGGETRARGREAL
jgi:SnoaL-like domain